MNTKEQLLLKFRRLQTIFSVIFFFFVLVFFLIVTEFNIQKIQISQWGMMEDLGWIFNYGLILVSLSTFFNVFFYIKNHNRIHHKNLMYFLFATVSFLLFLVGLFPVEVNPSIHNFSFFFLFKIIF